MSTNILLFIIIVLLVLVLFFQILQLAAISWLPGKFVDSFIDSTEHLLDSDQTKADVEVIETDADNQSNQKNSKGFSNWTETILKWI